jgi:hypothetical protein
MMATTAAAVSAHPKVALRCTDCGASYEGLVGGKYGPCCRWKHRGRTAKLYVWTPERDQVLRERYDSRTRGAIATLARGIGWPPWVIKKRARTLGLTHSVDRKDWSEPETTFLWEHGGTRAALWIAKQLGRSETSVVLRFKRMKISRRVREGYTLRELTLCFGTDHHVIERWVREGKLADKRRETARARDPWAVTDADLLTFVSDHPLAFRLDKVDQTWFMDLITSGGLIRKALVDERALQTASGSPAN